MARLFDDGSSQYLVFSSAAVSDHPMTFACWYNLDDVSAANNPLISIGDITSWNQYWILECKFSSLRASIADAGESVAIAAATSTSNVWQHATAVFESNVSRAVYLNGGNKGTNNVDRTPAGANATYIGRKAWAGTTYVSGAIAYPCIWNVALSNAEVLWLARGGWPGHCRPGNLVFFPPLHGPTSTGDNDIFGRYHLTAYNTPTWTDGPHQMDEAFARFYAMGAA